MEQHDGDGALPSSRSVQRYADGVQAQVGDLRATLRAALDEAEQHEAAGRPDLAVAALERQRAALAQVHARLEHLTASAAVEREAEHVLRGAVAPPSRPTASRQGAGWGARQVPGGTSGRRRRRWAAVAAVTFVTAATGAAAALTGGVQPPPRDPAVVAVAPVEVESAPPPSSAPTRGQDGAGQGAAAGDAPAPGQGASAASNGGAPVPGGAVAGDGATPRGGLDVLVQQVVDTLAALVGDSTGDDATETTGDGGADVGEPAPATDDLQDVVPSEPVSGPSGSATGDDAPTGPTTPVTAAVEGSGADADQLP